MQNRDQNKLQAQFTKINFANKSQNQSDTILSLDNKNVIETELSDHHPLIHNHILFWNIMMQCKARKNHDGKIIGYNNGFGKIETDKQYINRLKKIATAIAEIIYFNRTIEIISLCEGPIDIKYGNALFNTLKSFDWMKPFLKTNNFYTTNYTNYPNWGLLTLTHQNFNQKNITMDIVEKSSVFNKIVNRFHFWELKYKNEKKYFALAHFPFAGDEQATTPQQLSFYGNAYSYLINKLLEKYSNFELNFAADFNFNPYLINKNMDGSFIPHHNSILFLNTNNQNIIKTVTVDGILLSNHAKQKFFTQRHDMHLFDKLKLEYQLAIEIINQSHHLSKLHQFTEIKLSNSTSANVFPKKPGDGRTRTNSERLLKDDTTFMKSKKNMDAVKYIHPARYTLFSPLLDKKTKQVKNDNNYCSPHCNII